MKRTKIISALVTLSLSLVTFGQQEPQFTQYLDNLQYYNPAYSGSRDMMNITALHRQQWVGYKGAPMTTTLAMNTPLKYKSLGVGVSLMNDKIGPTNATWFNADFSYSLRFKKHDGHLSFGVKAGINLLNGDLSKLSKQDATDVDVNYRYQGVIQPNFGGGIYYHSKQWFVGVSVPKILQNVQDATSIKYLDQRHYYLTLGGYVNVNRMLKIRPSAMLKITENTPMALDGTLAFIIYDKFWLGANYRVLESAGLFAQFQISNQFKIGYAFEMSTSKLIRYNAGTHEILLSYDFLFKKKTLTSPRYF